MFVSNSNEDITVELSALEPGWKIKGSSVKVRKENYDVTLLCGIIRYIGQSKHMRVTRFNPSRVSGETQ